MGDLEFEEFKNHFEDVPQHIRAPAYTYTYVKSSSHEKIQEYFFILNPSPSVLHHKTACHQGQAAQMGIIYTKLKNKRSKEFSQKYMQRLL